MLGYDKMVPLILAFLLTKEAQIARLQSLEVGPKPELLCHEDQAAFRQYFKSFTNGLRAVVQNEKQFGVYNHTTKKQKIFQTILKTSQHQRTVQCDVAHSRSINPIATPLLYYENFFIDWLDHFKTEHAIILVHHSDYKSPGKQSAGGWQQKA